jgi:hypothetical protein
VGILAAVNIAAIMACSHKSEAMGDHRILAAFDPSATVNLLDRSHSERLKRTSKVMADVSCGSTHGLRCQRMLSHLNANVDLPAEQ